MLHRRSRSQTGYTFIEIMVSLAILGILSAIAIPAYNGYVRTARTAEGKESIATLHLAQVEYFEENGFFFTFSSNADLLTAAHADIQWRPTPWQQGLSNAENLANLNFNYVVANCAGGATNGSGDPVACYRITATGQNMLSAAEVLTETN